MSSTVFAEIEFAENLVSFAGLIHCLAMNGWNLSHEGITGHVVDDADAFDWNYTPIDSVETLLTMLESEFHKERNVGLALWWNESPYHPITCTLLKKNELLIGIGNPSHFVEWRQRVTNQSWYFERVIKPLISCSVLTNVISISWSEVF